MSVNPFKLLNSIGLLEFSYPEFRFITQLTVTEKWLSDDGKPLWLSVNTTLKEYTNENVIPPTPLAVVNNNEPINSQNVSPADQLGQHTNPQVITLAQTVATLMQSEALAIELEQQIQIAQTTGLSEGAKWQLAQGLGLGVNSFVDSSQNAVDGLNRLLLSGSQSVISNTMLSDCNSLVAQAKVVKDLFHRDNLAENLLLVIGQVQSVATIGKAVMGQVTADIAKNNAWLMLR